MQNLESDNILDWLLQVSGQAGWVGWQLSNYNDKTCWVALPFSSVPTLVSHLTSYNSISIARTMTGSLRALLLN